MFWSPRYYFFLYVYDNHTDILQLFCLKKLKIPSANILYLSSTQLGSHTAGMRYTKKCLSTSIHSASDPGSLMGYLLL